MLKGDSDLSYAVIGKAMEVHRELGPGLQEPLYHQFLSERLNAAELPHHFKLGGVLIHRGVRADEFEADLLFDGRLVAEVKVLDEGFAPDHFTQVICYQKFWSIPVGFLFDFGKESLIYKRVVFDDHRPSLQPTKTLVSEAPSFVSDRTMLTQLWESISRIYNLYGLGYRDTTYRGLLIADLTAERIPHRIRPRVTVRAGERSFGQSELNCIEIINSCAVTVLALRHSIRAADRAIAQTYLKLLDVPWGMIVNFGKKELEYRYIVRQRK
jgi:GxxExxY protein